MTSPPRGVTWAWNDMYVPVSVVSKLAGATAVVATANSANRAMLRIDNFMMNMGQ